MSVLELMQAIKEGRKLVWFDPQPIDGNDYLISFIENVGDDFDEATPILIQYNEGGSEAQVFASEIKKVLTIDEFLDEIGRRDAILEELQEEEAIWDFPLSEMGYCSEEHPQTTFSAIEINGEVRLIEMP